MGGLLSELERLARERDVDGYLAARWEFHALLPRIGPDAARRRGRAPLLALRALQPPRPLDAERFRRSVANYRRLFAACKAATRAAAEQVIHEVARGRST